MIVIKPTRLNLQLQNNIHEEKQLNEIKIVFEKYSDAGEFKKSKYHFNFS